MDRAYRHHLPGGFDEREEAGEEGSTIGGANRVGKHGRAGPAAAIGGASRSA
jgi:hypothetical protein